MTTPSNTIGYFGIVVPEDNDFSGAFLLDDEEIRQQAVKLQMLALAATPFSVIGSLQAAIVDGCLNGRQDVVMVAARALHGITKDKFFIVIGYREPDGLRTEARPLNASTIDEARSALENAPEVMKIRNYYAEGGKGKLTN